jgi:hypothetical protein
MPATVDTNQRIRDGLKFLTKADIAAVRAGDLLQKIEGVPHPAGVADLIQDYTFDVEGIHYKGRMTQPQHDYLAGKTATLDAFADAIVKIILNMNAAFLDVIGDLNHALGAPPARARKAAAVLNGGSVIPPPPVGCCTYDDNEQQDGVTQSFCVGGLQGTWDSNPCGTSIPPSTNEKKKTTGRRQSK